ncbi:DUF1402 family protein [Acuticoccus kandeliae]|uniref:DUF1402 family protein n=1 Tax=Acuticoccus kandeliae TaxID=2073160 RepID=UPI000D3E5AF9|nr:DUF1402 family protein [Acuticoccus kandeliae]
MSRAFAVVLLALTFLCAPASAWAQANSAPTTYGKHALPQATQERLKATRTTIPIKMRRTLDVLRQGQLLSKIKRTAAAYGIDPIHILGAIVGEHALNYDIRDNLQQVALQFARRMQNVEFSCGQVSLERVLAMPEFKQCRGNSNAYWTCVESNWSKVRGKSVDGVRLPRRNLTESCFNPFATGQTYGLGQLSPVTALKMSDTTKLPPITYKDADRVYERIIDPDESLNVIAAVIVDAIQAYRAVGVDISDKPGITATLYNLGNPRERARRSRGRPKVNYYGAFVEDHIDTLRDLLN